MSRPQTITLDFRPGHEPVTQTDFTYAITPDTITITDTGKGKVPVANDIEAVLRKIEYWHQGSIAGFKIRYRDQNGMWPAFDGMGNMRCSVRQVISRDSTERFGASKRCVTSS
jgi:hypothetical protein